MGFRQIDLGDGLVVSVQVHDDDAGALANETHGLEKLQEFAKGAGVIASTFRENLVPDEVTLEVSVGFSTEVGWFFAKSEVEAIITLSLAWNK